MFFKPKTKKALEAEIAKLQAIYNEVDRRGGGAVYFSEQVKRAGRIAELKSHLNHAIL
ncbi:hypothetical protein SAMN05444156_3245 [Verrucomicrobium sp. GAS474]|uniref:hypothetical protein n=1 Tax=Verrucomicrobium sp. GAS474 TaxID=1882831 RepID=UPI00087B8351|nr:hypothetical protein [Verrucomicrobium sp. GAS474]SDT85639.1 hypothetical protein SAMN05444156_0007 [Verrucomicrobium sp. GAS474]SDU31508.1 hypothetical protein SAMN05444156_3245 [Verrucomicrobium sp. GAS474]